MYCKLQVGCILIVLYFMFIYLREKRIYRFTKKDKLFDWLLGASAVSILFDGTTAYTVNHLDSTPPLVNSILHMGFLLSLGTMIFLMFLYMLDITKGIPKKHSMKLAL